MSGDAARVALAGGPEVEQLIRVLGRLADLGSGFTLVGGVAVVTRLAVVHRATTDLDTVSGGRPFEEAVLAIASAQKRAGALFVDGVRIDAIEVAEVGWQEIGEIADPGDRLFAAAHLWALRESSAVLIEAGEASALVSVALPQALLATKLHAYCSPRRDPDKHGSDALDVYRLAGLVVRSESGAFRGAPAPVVASLRWAVEQHWLKTPAQMAGRLRRMTPALRRGPLLCPLPSSCPVRAPRWG